MQRVVNYLLKFTFNFKDTFPVRQFGWNLKRFGPVQVNLAIRK